MPKRVLVIDDEPGICDIVCLNLESEGYQAECAQSGRAALAKIKAASPDAVILDIMMPEIDGWEVLSHIKNDPVTRDIPIILLSAKSEVTWPGKNGHSAKPLSQDTTFPQTAWG